VDAVVAGEAEGEEIDPNRIEFYFNSLGVNSLVMSIA
jgi:hypothetical protein